MTRPSRTSRGPSEAGVRGTCGGCCPGPSVMWRILLPPRPGRYAGGAAPGAVGEKHLGAVRRHGRISAMGHVEAAHIDYYLPDGRALLADVSFRVGDGAAVALV